MTIIKGSFISVWEQGTIQTDGTLNTETGEVTATSVDPGDDLGGLEREYFEGRQRRRAGSPMDTLEYEVCTNCHEYILTTVMVPDNTGKGLHEEKLCSNPECRG